jgi:hypothetical protein
MEGGRAHLRRTVQRSCHRLECGECHGQAAARAGHRVAERLLQVGELLRRREPRHWAWSPVQDLWIQRFSKCDGPASWAKTEGALRAATLRAAKKAGLEGGLAVVHAYRCDQKDGRDRYHVGQLQIAPHVHVIAWGFSSDDDARAKGWVVANLTHRRQVRTGRPAQLDGDGLSAVVAYLVDHAALVKGRQSYAYWGVAGNNQVVVADQGVRREPVECPCGSACFEFGVDVHGLVDWDRVKGPAVNVVRWRRYELRAAP